MVDVELSVEGVSLNFTSKISEKEVSTCLCCEELRLEHHKTKLEISSYEEIFKLVLLTMSSHNFHLQKRVRLMSHKV